MTGWNVFRRSGTAQLKMGLANTLSGYFELRVGWIVGWIMDRYQSDVASMQVKVRRGGFVIASCFASPEPEQRRFVFSLPIDHGAIGSELVREQVIVVAEDSDGNTGRLMLDGAAQLELIREYLGPPAAVVVDLDFSRGGNARPNLGTGWAGCEADFTWTMDEESTISFDTPAEAGTYRLRITSGPFIRKPDVPAQELKVFIDAAQIAYIVQTEGHVQFQEWKFPHEAFANTSRTTLRLLHSNAARPSDLGINGDTRRLAFRFKRLTVVRLLPILGSPGGERP